MREQRRGPGADAARRARDDDGFAPLAHELAAVRAARSARASRLSRCWMRALPNTRSASAGNVFIKKHRHAIARGDDVHAARARRCGDDRIRDDLRPGQIAHRRVHRRAHETRLDQRHVDVEAAHLPAHRVAQPAQPELRRRIDPHHPCLAGDRADVDDRAAPLRLHHRQHRVHQSAPRRASSRRARARARRRCSRTATGSNRSPRRSPARRSGRTRRAPARRARRRRSAR